MKSVRFGIVGAGVIGKTHREAISQVEAAELAAVCDVERERAETLVGDTVARVFTNYREMIVSGDVDVVSVCTPHTSHPQIAICAFENGLHVLCEKPLATHVNAAREMHDAAAGTSLKFGVCFQKRTEPLYRKAKELIEGGELGNAMVLSGAIGKTVTLPLDGDAYEQFLRKKIAASGNPPTKTFLR